MAAFLFSSAMTAPDVAACIEAVNILESDELVRGLWQNAALMRQELQRMGFDTGHSQTPSSPHAP
ncbi:MAG: hypothetical protein U0X20_05205 [Caldilineaceae bacterium]